MKNKDRFDYLLQLYADDIISPKERDEFFSLLHTSEYDSLLAGAIANDLETGIENATGDLPPHIAQELVRNIINSEKNTAKILPIAQKPKLLLRWVAAASVIIIASLFYFYFNNTNSNSNNQFANQIPSATIIKENSTAETQKIILSDGSLILLHPESSVYYLRNFASDAREIYLEGSAFFQVEKNAEKPFIVYHNDLVTKVLGTSFSINTNQSTGNVEVTVTTGKVQVYENKNILKDNSGIYPVILTPNQKAIYNTEKRILETSVADDPQPIVSHEKKAAPTFVYEQEKIGVIFKQLEEVFGIEIIVENERLNDCIFTGDVSDQDLFTRLKIICVTTNSSYEVNGTKILIKGKGCQ